MKTTSEYIALLRKYMAENAHKYGIVRMGIFGSVARGEQTENSDVDVFLLSESGMMKLDSICMKLTAIGESIKNLDKVTNKELLAQYPEIPWRYVMGVRDIIVHHYFDVDADEIYRICLEDIPQLQQAIKRMLDDLKTDNLIMG